MRKLLQNPKFISFSDSTLKPAATAMAAIGLKVLYLKLLEKIESYLGKDAWRKLALMDDIHICQGGPATNATTTTTSTPNNNTGGLWDNSKSLIS